jgi:hypothetical protein
MSQPPQPQSSGSPGAARAVSTFIRELEAVDLFWSVKKSIARAWQAGITDIEQVCADVEEQAASKVRWAQQDGDALRVENWTRVSRVMKLDHSGFAAYVARRLEWLALSSEQQQERLAANRRPATDKQLRFLRELGADVSDVDESWQASRLIDKLLRERGS